MAKTTTKKVNIKYIVDGKQLDESVASVDNLNDGLKDMDESGKKGSKGLKAVATGFKAIGTALKAAGIGLVVALIATLFEAVKQNQPIMDAFNTVMTTISNTFSAFVGSMVDVYTWVTASSDRFDALGKVISGVIDMALVPMKLQFYGIKLAILEVMLGWNELKAFLGSDEGNEQVRMLNADIRDTKKAIDETIDAGAAGYKAVKTNIAEAGGEIIAIGKKIKSEVGEINIAKIFEGAGDQTDIANRAKLAVAINDKLLQQYDKQAELQRQIRDDEDKTFEERIAANEKLGKVLDEQEKLMLANAKINEEAAKLALDANKDNVDLQVAYQEALTVTADVEATVAGFRSEQMVNAVALQNELIMAMDEVSLAGMTHHELAMNQLLIEYREKIKLAKKAGVETGAIDKKYEADKSKLAAANAAKNIDVTANAIGQIADLFDKSNEKEFKAQKALRIGQAVMSTASGIMNAYASLPTPAAIIASVGIAAAGVAQIAAIKKEKFNGGGSSPSAPNISANVSNTAPSISESAIASSERQAAPMQAYVVHSDIEVKAKQAANIAQGVTI